MAAYKILIVDDSKAIRLQVRDMLPPGNFEVSEAKDGIEALDLIRQDVPHLMLLDFFMPRMNGWEVLLRIQHQPEWQLIPIVVMTGRREEAEAKVPEMFRHFEFIEKPFDQRTLISAVRSAMSKAKQRQSIAGTLSTPGTTSSPSSPKATETPHVSAVPPATPHLANATPQSTHVTPDVVTALQAEITTLKEQNARLQADFEVLRLQVTQLASYVKQKLS
ncbi:MAG: response regulator [Cyanobacteria bacterium]|nr:response regulator [Cyanobacteriota bacterium]MDW8200511.1 response regulator [Cyanobacteriota bacterium SKYGB_h_bin112]